MGYNCLGTKQSPAALERPGDGNRTLEVPMHSQCSPVSSRDAISSLGYDPDGFSEYVRAGLCMFTPLRNILRRRDVYTYKGGAYVLYNLCTHRAYVGSTASFRQRLDAHV